MRVTGASASQIPVITYSIDSGRRVRTVALTLAALSVALVHLLHGMAPMPPSLIAALSLMLYGIVFWLYNAVLWKFPVINRFNSIPNLAGRWQGKLVGWSAPDDELDVTLQVRQNWSEVGFVLSSTAPLSRATVGAMVIGDPDNVKVIWVFSSDTSAVPCDHRQGVNELTLHKADGGDRLTGTWFSDIGTSGALTVRFVK